MEKSFWISELQSQVNDNEIISGYISEYNFQLYLFGSAMISEIANDIDILLIYPDNKSVNKALELKKMLINYLRDLNDMEIHMILLSVQENEEINFLKKERAVKI